MTCFGPFEYQTSSLFRSPLYSDHGSIMDHSTTRHARSIKYQTSPFLTDGSTRKNIRRRNGIYNVLLLLTWFRFVQLLNRLFPSKLEVHFFMARQADRRAIIGTELYTTERWPQRSIYIGRSYNTIIQIPTVLTLFMTALNYIKIMPIKLRGGIMN